MRYGLTALTAAALAVATGCGLRADQAYVNAMPDISGLTLEVTGDALAESSAAKASSELGQAQSAASVVPEYVADARDGARRVNEAIRQALEPIKEMLANDEGRPAAGEVRIYGPKDHGNVTYRLVVKRFTATAYGWRLQAKPLNADDLQYVNVMSGAVAHPAENTRKGVIGINFNNLKMVDDSFPGQGILMAGFMARDGNKTLAFRLNAFTPDTTAHDPVTAQFVGHKRAADGAIAVRAAGYHNFENLPNATDTKELVRIHARWLPGTGGRAMAVATGGDIPDGEAYVGVACFNASLEEGFKAVRHCVGTDPATRTCTEVFTSGSPAACQLTDSTEPSVDPMDGTLDADAPDLVSAPTAEPTGDTAP